MAEKQTFVIIGASLAGARAAEALRTHGFDGRIVLVGAEAVLPYERPPLSKAYLRGEAPADKALVHPREFYDEHDIELLLGVGVTELDAREQRVTLDDGRELTFDRALLTTGATPRRLPVPGVDLAGVLVLRDLGDSDALRQRLQAGARLVVIGAGWIGAEVAASARQLGAEVTMIEVAHTPLERVLGPRMGAFYAEVHRAHGVRLLTGTGVEAIEGGDRVERVRTSDGQQIACDVVLVGVGVRPRAALAEAAGLDVDDGVVTDARLCTSAPTVFAAGDVANAWHPWYEHRVRVEHWANARNQGPAAAQAMLGHEVSYDRLPYFFSDQYDVGMEYSGLADPDDQVVVRGDTDRAEFIAFWLRDGRVTAGMNVNVWEVTPQIQALIRARAEVDPARLADPDVPLDELFAATG